MMGRLKSDESRWFCEFHLRFNPGLLLEGKS
jgi:hypothetical protein